MFCSVLLDTIVRVVLFDSKFVEEWFAEAVDDRNDKPLVRSTILEPGKSLLILFRDGEFRNCF